MENRELVKELITVSMLHRYSIMTTAAQSGLYYGQPMMLDFIMQNPECTQRNLADALNISPASAATSLRRMEKSGLVSRSQDTADSRKNRLSVTEQGIQALDRFHTICDDTDKKLLKNFSEEELLLLMELMKRLHSNLEINVSREELHKAIHQCCEENGGNEKND